jgi:predicted PurR-regulated permease PerM
MKPVFAFDREHLVPVFFFIAFAWVAYQLVLLTIPFLPGLLIAAMLVIGFAPLAAWTRRQIKNPHLGAMLLTVGVLLVVVLPLIGIGRVLFREAGRLLPTVQAVMEDIHNQDLISFQQHVPAPLYSAFTRISPYFDAVDIDLKEIILDHASQIGAMIRSSGVFLARHAVFALFNVVVMVVILFFAFRDGSTFWRRFLGVVPMRSDHKEAIAARVYETFRAVTIGVFVTAAAQGLTATIGFIIADVRLPLLLGLGTAMVSLLGASFLVTVPVALFVMSQSKAWGIFLLIWGMVVVGMLDNLLKPILIGSKARMPFFLIFFSIIGGIKLYGPMGFMLGPILVASFLTFVKIYREEYLA